MSFDFPAHWGNSDSDEEDFFKSSRFPLHDCAEVGNLERLTALLNPEKEKKDEVFDPEASEEESDDEDVNIDERDRDDCTPLHVAILGGHTGCAKALLEHGAETFIRCEGSPVLHLAVCIGAHAARTDASLQAIELLLDNEVDPNVVDDYARTALHMCAFYALDRQAALLVERGAKDSLEVADSEGFYPIHYAAQHSSSSTLELLVANGGSPDATDFQGRTALHVAVLANSKACVAFLMGSSPALAAVCDSHGTTALAMAEQCGFDSISEYMTRVGSGEPPPTEETTGKAAPTVIIAPEECHEHRTSQGYTISRDRDPPPENMNRLHVLTHPASGILRSELFKACEWVGGQASSQPCRPAALVDVLRVHEYSYIRTIQAACSRIGPGPDKLGHLDGDTAISAGSFSAALHAAGAVTEAVDRVVSGRARNAFCAVRPPGHHAGPTGAVPCGNDPHSSHGFCLLNNVAIGAAYARCVHRDVVRRVAIVDFDVHHGNGTQACVQACVPSVRRVPFFTNQITGSLDIPSWKPWLDDTDAESVFFASSQGYGMKDPDDMLSGWFYPGSGVTFDNRKQHASSKRPLDASSEEYMRRSEDIEMGFLDPRMAGAGKEDKPPSSAPQVVNIGLVGTCPGTWRDAWRERILPSLVDFKPDLIIISSGFDAHMKDDVNCGYIGVTEADYSWLTTAIMEVANTCCSGRVVSVLEGGYRIQGGVVSAFSRSAEAHVAALLSTSTKPWAAEEHRAVCKERERQQQARQQRARAASDDALPAALVDEAPDDDNKWEGAELPLEDAEVPGPREQTPAPALAADPAGGDDAEGPPAKRSRRGGGAVDYQALNAELEAEMAAGAPAPAALGPSAMDE